MARVYTARQAGEKLGLTHQEVIRRIRRGDIKASKFGWNWVVPVEEVERVKDLDWYKRVMARRTSAA